MIWRLSLSLLLFASAVARAVPESEFAGLWKAKLIPFSEAHPRATLTGEAGIQIAYQLYHHGEPSAGTILVAPGFSENFTKYVEVAYDLFEKGYSVVLFDHRGQGYSQRLISDWKRGHIDDFENLVKDMHTVFEQVVKKEKGPYFLLAHSMGGGVGARYSEEFPGDFKTIVLSAPMLDFQVKAWQRPIYRALLALGAWTGFDSMYMRGPHDPTLFTFAKNSKGTQSEVRYTDLQLAPVAADPKLGLWGLDARWVHQSLLNGDRVQHDAQKAQVPILLLQADDDRYVYNGAQDEFCSHAPHCTLKHLEPGSRHELLIERDSVRNQALTEILGFFR